MFAYIRDSVIQNKRYKILRIACYSCKSSNHTVLNCPYFFYGQNKPDIVKKSIEKDKIWQTTYVRKDKKKKSINSLLIARRV